MPPWKENQEQLIDDVRVGDVEVVLQCADVDVAVELWVLSVSALSFVANC